MVRLINNKNLKYITNTICFVFGIQKHFTHIINVNKPDVNRCIYAMWHNHQFCLYGIPDKSKINVMISHSLDGNLISDVIQKLFGFKVVRGSQGRCGAIKATKQLVELLKTGESGAIMVDGPKGPAHVVKKGIIKIAKLSGTPIVPITWYSEDFNFIKFPSWDKLEMPILNVNLINLYGEPIYVPPDGDADCDEKIRMKLQESLINLDNIVKQKYREVYKRK